MKNLFRLALLAMLAFAMTSCADTEKFLIKADGEWSIETFDYTHIVINNSPTSNDTTETEIDVPANSGSTMTFTKDGTGVFTMSDGTDTFPFPFTYTIDEDAETITIIFTGGLLDSTIVFDITESTKDVQRYSVSNSSETTTGDVTTKISENGTVVLNKN